MCKLLIPALLSMLQWEMGHTGDHVWGQKDLENILITWEKDKLSLQHQPLQQITFRTTNRSLDELNQGELTPSSEYCVDTRQETE